MVTTSLFIFLGWFRFIHSTLPISMALLFFIGVGIYYLLLDFQVGGLVLLAYLPLLILAHFLSQAGTKISITAFLIFFVVGWVFQLLGHYFEKRRPALLDNFAQVFNAPLFLVCELLFKLNKRPDLKAFEVSS